MRVMFSQPMSVQHPLWQWLIIILPALLPVVLSPSNDDIRHLRDDHLQTPSVWVWRTRELWNTSMSLAASSLLMRLQWDHSMMQLTHLILICSAHLHTTLVNTEQDRFICKHQHSTDQSHERSEAARFNSRNQFMSCRAAEICSYSHTSTDTFTDCELFTAASDTPTHSSLNSYEMTSIPK